MEQQRPTNPYRRSETRDGALWGEASMGAVGKLPRRHDTETGPGLLASDIDRMCRQHFVDGHAAGQRSREAEAVATQQALAEAFDEGAAAQDGLNTALVWRTVHDALIARVHWPLRGVEDAPKSKRDEAIAKLRQLVDELLAEAAAVHAGR